MMHVKLLRPDAKKPMRATLGSAGYDLYCPDEVVLKPGTTTTIMIGVAIWLPAGTCGQIWTRSGMAKRGLHVGAGLIDVDYHGELGIVLHNHGAEEYIIGPGDRIAQLVVVPIALPVVEVDGEAKEDDTMHGGFGSTGK